ncbi:MAG: hypothetical protein Q9198_010090 [Flavoplaca austrocitrina]
MQPKVASDFSRSQELGQTLRNLNRSRYPHVQNPPGCKKRASVALIIRVRPTFPDTATFDTSACGLPVESDQARLNAFFAQEWVQRGDPEVLFIKRSARKGDRWTSHIAFPGGGRDPEDKDDLAASIRETREEIGMDLEADHCLNVGNLSERIVTAWLGKTPYVPFASCSYVFQNLPSQTDGPVSFCLPPNASRHRALDLAAIRGPLRALGLSPCLDFAIPEQLCQIGCVWTLRSLR